MKNSTSSSLISCLIADHADNDVLADAIVIAKTLDGDENKTRIIPIFQRHMSQNLPYFEGIFRKGSNWSENKQNDKIKEIIIPCENPLNLAVYLKSLFSDSLAITPENCSELYHYARYFQDDLFKRKIEEFIRKNIT